jgi:hypothetical protein
MHKIHTRNFFLQNVSAFSSIDVQTFWDLKYAPKPKMNKLSLLALPTRGVQIRSESDPIGFVRISEQKYTFRIGLIKLFCSRIGPDRTSIFEIKWINYPRIIARINYPCIYQSIIAVVSAFFVRYFNWASICQLLDMYFLFLYWFG